MLTFYPSRIPDPGVKKAPDPGSVHHNTVYKYHIFLSTCISTSLLFHETEFCAIGCVAENSSVREVAQETWPQLSSMGNMFRKLWPSVNRKRKLGEDVLRNLYLAYCTYINWNQQNASKFDWVRIRGLFSTVFQPAVALSSHAGTLNKCYAVDLTCTGVTKTNN
jgi:hypothetical protein